MDNGALGGTLSPDILWVLLCGFLVALMQAGFACLESGMVRAKNSINVAIKNLVDFCITGVLFTAVGFGVMFGSSIGGWIGVPYFALQPGQTSAHISFVIFQLMFAGTAATIISGAVAERMSFMGYLITTVIIAGAVYPVAGHWVWAGADVGQAWGWLARMGFHDFAGATVVHSVGGWLALAAVLVIGPRIGRFGPEGRPIEGDNLPTATLGVFLLWFGFFGFNGGSTFALDARVPGIIANTAVAGGAGGLAGLLVSWAVWKHPVVSRIVNGVIAGLVASCGAVDLIGGLDAIILGAVAGVLCVGAMRLMERLEIDDVVGAVPAHLVAGVWGTLAVALFAPESALVDGSRGAQFMVQLLGVAVVGAFAFGVGYVLLRVIDRFVPLRVSANDERIGLNVSEHGASTSLLELITQMDSQARHGDFSRPVSVDPETDAANIAVFYNAVLDKFRIETERRHAALERLNLIVNQDPLTGVANRRRFLERLDRAVSRARRHAARFALLYLDLDGFKCVNDSLGHAAGDALLKESSHRMEGCLRDLDMLARIGGDEFAILLEDLEAEEGPERVAERLLDALDEPFALDRHSVRISASIGIARFGGPAWRGDASTILHAADHAMYDAKLAGKGIWRLAAPLETARTPVES